MGLMTVQEDEGPVPPVPMVALEVDETPSRGTARKGGYERVIDLSITPTKTAATKQQQQPQSLRRGVAKWVSVSKLWWTCEFYFLGGRSADATGSPSTACCCCRTPPSPPSTARSPPSARPPACSRGEVEGARLHRRHRGAVAAHNGAADENQLRAECIPERALREEPG